MHPDFFRPVSNQIDDCPYHVGTNAEPLQNFLGLIQDVFRGEPNEVVLLCPPVEHIGTRISTSNKGLSEARYARYQNTCINHDARLATSNFLRQR